MRRARATFSVATAMIVASIAVACSLNPQPIPPGEQPDGSTAGGGNNPNLSDADAGDKTMTDGGHFGADAAADTGPMPPPPVDSGTDASDASDDADAHD